MVNTKSPTPHISISSSNEVAQICQPLFKFLDIDYFTFHRVFPNGKIIRLSSYPEWTEHYFEKNYFRMRIDQYPSLYESAYHLWDYSPPHGTLDFEAIVDATQHFHLKSGFTVLKGSKQYVETFNFAKICSHRPSSYPYLQNLDSLEKFLEYFKVKAMPLIKKAELDKISARDRDLSDLNGIKNEQEVSKKREEFLRAIHLDRIQVQVGNQNVLLSKQETTCLRNYLKGKSAKLIASEMGLSPRTVEHYLESLKTKLHCYSKSELIEKAIQAKSSQLL